MGKDQVDVVKVYLYCLSLDLDNDSNEYFNYIQTREVFILINFL